MQSIAFFTKLEKFQVRMEPKKYSNGQKNKTGDIILIDFKA
jgi:hypothetical protein